MRVPDDLVKLVHRLIGFGSGKLTITKKNAQVVQVELDGRVLPPAEWQRPGDRFAVVEQPARGEDVPRGTKSSTPDC